MSKETLKSDKEVTDGVKIVEVKDALMHEQPDFGPKPTQTTQNLQLKAVKVKFGELQSNKKLEMQKKFKDEIEQISKVRDILSESSKKRRVSTSEKVYISQETRITRKPTTESSSILTPTTRMSFLQPSEITTLRDSNGT